MAIEVRPADVFDDACQAIGPKRPGVQERLRHRLDARRLPRVLMRLDLR